MGLFEKIFSKPIEQNLAPEGYWQTLTAYQPTFSSRSGSNYEAVLVRASIDAIQRHNGKLNVVFEGNAKKGLVKTLKRAPNPYMTWYQFLARVSAILYMENSSFIVPMYDAFGNINGVFPILPSRSRLVEYKGEPWVQYTFNNNKKGSIKLSDCGILTRQQFKEDIYGDSASILGSALDDLNFREQAFKEAVKLGLTDRFRAKFNNWTTTKDLSKGNQKFTDANFKSESDRMYLFPNTYEDIQQIITNYQIDSKEKENIEKNVYSFFGVNENILQNKATDSELDSFFSGEIEPFSIQLSEVLTKMLFSDTEIDFGNRIIFAANRIQYLSTSERVNIVQQLGDRGMLFIDEARELLNYPPLPNGIGQHIPIRGEFYFVGEERPQEGEENAVEE